MAASNPALIVRVAATIAELKANLAEGKSQIETTTAAMGKLAASFSGDKLIQQAQNVTAAVNSIGGASKLTEAEQARVNATIEKALEKYRALGREAPAGMQALADETKGANTASSSLTDTVKQLAMGFAAMFTARAAFSFVKDTINEASALKDLSTQTHINVEDLQLLAGGMSEFGVDADELGKGLYKLSRGIAGGDESVSRGLHLMGMSLKDVEGLQGKELFLKIESGLSTLQGGLRDTAAAELFGGKLGAAMAGASEGIEGALDTWQRLNTVASTESVDAMDAFGESIERASKNVTSIAANMIGPLAQGFNVLFEASNKGASTMSLFWASTKDAMAASFGLGSGTENLTRLLDEQNIATEKDTRTAEANTLAHQEVAKAVDTRSAAVKFMAALEADAAVELSAAQIKNLEHLKEIGALNAKNAEGIGVGAAAYAKYTAEVEKAAKATKNEAEAQKDLDAIRKLSYAEAMSHEKEWRAEIEKTKDARNKAVIDGLTEIQQAEHALHDEINRQTLDSTDYQVNKIWEVVAEQEKAFKGTEEQRASFNTAVERLAQWQADAIIETAQKAAATVVATWQQAAAVVAMFGGLPSMYATSAPLAGRTPGSVGTTGSLAQSGVVSFPPYMGEYGRASGGPVSAGQSYVVGERGPERLTMGASSGFITPNGGGGAIRDVHVHVDGHVLGTQYELARLIKEALLDDARSLGGRL